MREYRHPEIDHTFMIRDITLKEKLNGENWLLEIDDVKLHLEDIDWMVMMANFGGGISEMNETVNINDLSLPLLQSVLNMKNKDEEK